MADEPEEEAWQERDKNPFGECPLRFVCTTLNLWYYLYRLYGNLDPDIRKIGRAHV